MRTGAAPAPPWPAAECPPFSPGPPPRGGPERNDGAQRSITGCPLNGRITPPVPRLPVMTLSEGDLAYLETNHSAAMITVARDGVARTARVGVALVDGKLWSSGTRDRVR